LFDIPAFYVNLSAVFIGLTTIQMVKFIGNVLPRTGHQPENDSTFDFTESEARCMELEGVPLRIEHADSLPIGKVEKCWDGQNGSKWIMGEIESDKGLASHYANHAIKPDSRGHTLYTGLSLQHVHQSWSDGTTNKRPVEISICTEPRRPDCYIRAVGQTGKNEYIAHKASDKYSMSSEQSTIEATETPAPVESSTVNDAVGKPGDTATPVSRPVGADEVAARNVANSQEELMKMFLAQDEKNNSMAQQLKQLSDEKTQLESRWKEREATENLQTASKAEALSKALVESWQKTLPAGEMTEENKKAIFALAQNFPKESVQMMEIAHKASMKHANTRTQLIETESSTKKRALEQQVVDTIMKRRRVNTADEVTHQASTKLAVETPETFNPFVSNAVSRKTEHTFATTNAHLFKALKGANQGSARSIMDSIAKYRNGNL
jgi:hypothetical protein